MRSVEPPSSRVKPEVKRLRVRHRRARSFGVPNIDIVEVGEVDLTDAAPLSLDPDQSATASGAPDRRSRHGSPVMVVSALAFAGVLVSLEATILIPVLAHLPEVYGVDTVTASWLVTSTLLAGALATPILTRMADLYGKRNMLLLSLGFMILGSVLLAVSDQIAIGLIGRSLHGFGAPLLPIAMSVLKDVLPPERLGSGIALVSATLGIGSAVGLPLAGALFGWWGWDSLFWLTGALGVVVAVVLRLLLPPDRPARQPFDLVGSVLLALGLTPLLLVIVQGNKWGWTSTPILCLAAFGIVAAALWAGWELRTATPLIDVRLAAERPILLTNAASLAISTGMFANMLLMSGQLGAPAIAGGMGLTSAAIGIATGIPALVLVVSAPAIGTLIRRLGAPRVLVAGGLVMSASYVARIFLDGSPAQIVLGVILVNVGTTLALAATPVIIMSLVPITQTASANGVNGLSRTIGTSVAAACLAALTSYTAITVGGVEVPTVRTNHIAFTALAIITFVASCIAFRIRTSEESASSVEPGSVPRSRLTHKH